MEIEPFGIIDIDNLEEHYKGLLQVHDDNIEVDLNFELESIGISNLQLVQIFILSIETYADKSFEAISKDFDLIDKSKTSQLYLQHHLKKLNRDELKLIFGTTEVEKSTFLKHIKLYRIGFYPEDNKSFAIFDIQLPREYTNYIIAVTFNRNGEISHVTIES